MSKPTTADNYTLADQSGARKRAVRWRVFAKTHDTETVFVNVFPEKRDARRLVRLLRERYGKSVTVWSSTKDIKTAPGGWERLKERLGSGAFAAKARALTKAREAEEPSSEVLLALAAKERRLAADALKLAIEKRSQAERRARAEIDRRARAAVKAAS